MGRKRVNKKCKVSGCQELHHARGFCNRHYKKYMRYDDPNAGRFRETISINPANNRDQTKPTLIFKAGKEKSDHYHFEPEPLKDMTGQGNYAFFLNQPTIEKLYGEIYKALHEPLYMAANKELIRPLLLLSLKYAGYRDNAEPAILESLLQELTDLINHKEKVKYMYTLANFDRRIERLKRPQRVKQMDIFNYS